MRRIGCAIVLLGLLGAILAGAAMWSWTGAGPGARDTSVVVPQGASLARTAQVLEDRGLVPSARRFLLLARIFGDDAPIRAGEYDVPKGASPSQILGLLQAGRTLQRFVTIPEGWPAVMVHDAIGKAPQMSGTVGVPEEGSVLPDSYGYDRDGSRAELLARMQKAMTDYLAQAWARRKPTTVARTPREALILASIVEKETSKPEERRTVAAVYSNRIRRGMPLQADPTTIYPITKGRPLGRRILRSELQAKNGYNTYAMTGLPVGPIANPGRASIDAVLDPAPSNALYFVADGSGGHVFADTLEQHNANVQRWYALRRSRGEM